jgi:D-aspartate ligase
MNLSRFMDACRDEVPAVVVSVSHATGVGLVRSLGVEGVPVWALDSTPDAIGLRSRYAYGSVCRDGYHDEEGFLQDLAEVGRRLPRRAVLFPAGDDYVPILSQHAERLSEWFIVAATPWEKLQPLSSKEEQVLAAWRFGVDTPRTAFVRDSGDLDEAVADVTFPALLKSAEPMVLRRSFGKKAIRVETPADLRRLYEPLDGLGVMLLQEFIPGGDDRVVGSGWYLNADSVPLAQFTWHKLRQHPRTFGEGRFGESVWVPSVAESCLGFYQGLGLTGIFGGEFKQDPRDGRYKLMEVNTRFCLSHGFARMVGVNIAYVAYRDAIGRPVTAPRQKEGPRWIMSTSDLPDSAREMLRGEMGGLEWLRSLRGTRYDGLQSLADPLPGLLEFVHIGRGRLQRASVRVH